MYILIIENENDRIVLAENNLMKPSLHAITIKARSLSEGEALANAIQFDVIIFNFAISDTEASNLVKTVLKISYPALVFNADSLLKDGTPKKITELLFQNNLYNDKMNSAFFTRWNFSPNTLLLN